MKEWVGKIQQPSPRMYCGGGVAKPSVFINCNNENLKGEIRAVMDDRGGPGSWMWQKVDISKTKAALMAISSTKSTGSKGASSEIKPKSSADKKAEALARKMKQQQDMVEAAKRRAMKMEERGKATSGHHKGPPNKKQRLT